MTKGSAGTSSFAARLVEHANARPWDIVVQCEQHKITWAAFAKAIFGISQCLRHANVSLGGRVAILGANSANYLTVFMGAIVAGGSAVTLPLMASFDALITMIDDSAAKILLYDDDNQSLAQEITKRRPNLRLLPFSILSEKDAADLKRPEFDINPDQEFNIVYSSGTTGIPKGILHSHRTRLSLAISLTQFGFDDQSATLISTPLYTNLSLPAFLTTLWAGGRTIVMPKFEAGQFLALAEKEKATHFFLVPTQLERIIRHPDFLKTDLSASRLKYVAGALLAPEIKQHALSDWPGSFVEVYGMTEGAPVTVLFADRYPNKLHTVGQVMPGGEIKIIDDHDQELAANKIGEVVGRSGAMMLGYNNRPDLTEALIWWDAQGRAFFRSGDLGKIDADGFLSIVGRKKDMIVSGGLNIYPADIEDILNHHSGVEEAAVIAIPSEQWGESPLALVVPKSGVVLDVLELLAWINERVGKHQRLSGVELRPLLPRNALGKVLKQELRAPYWQKQRVVT